MSLHYEIFQIQNSNDQYVSYRLFQELSEEVKTVDLKKDNYKKIFEGELRPNSKRKFNSSVALNYLFELFNINCPIEFTGRSLSVSDIIKLEDKYYHCQSIGWKEIEIIV